MLARGVDRSPARGSTAVLLESENPAVRAVTLQRLLDRPVDDPDVTAARHAALSADPIAAILAAQSPEGWWVRPGPGYAPKYTGTVWSLIFLDQLGADPRDERVQRGCAYVLEHCPTSLGGLGCSGSHRTGPPPPSSVLHVLVGGPPVRDRDPQHRAAAPPGSGHPRGAVGEHPPSDLLGPLVAAERRADLGEDHRLDRWLPARCWPDSAAANSRPPTSRLPRCAQYAAVCSAAATPGRYAAWAGSASGWSMPGAKPHGAGPDVRMSGAGPSCCEYGTSMLRYEGISVTAG